MHDAKTNFSRLVAAIKSGAAHEIVIAQNGVPAARLVPVEPLKKMPLWGAAKGKWNIPDDIDDLNPEIDRLFNGGDD